MSSILSFKLIYDYFNTLLSVVYWVVRWFCVNGSNGKFKLVNDMSQGKCWWVNGTFSPVKHEVYARNNDFHIYISYSIVHNTVLHIKWNIYGTSDSSLHLKNIFFRLHNIFGIWVTKKILIFSFVNFFFQNTFLVN